MCGIALAPSGRPCSLSSSRYSVSRSPRQAPKPDAAACSRGEAPRCSSLSLAAPAVVRVPACCAVLCLQYLNVWLDHPGNRVLAKGRRRLLGRVLTSRVFASGLSTLATLFSYLQRISTADTGASQSRRRAGTPWGFPGNSQWLVPVRSVRMGCGVDQDGAQA